MSWLSKKLDTVRARVQDNTKPKDDGGGEGMGVGAGGFDCTMCHLRRVSFATLEQLQQHYLDSHTSDDGPVSEDEGADSGPLAALKSLDPAGPAPTGAADATPARRAKERGAREVVRLEGELEAAREELVELRAKLVEERWFTQTLQSEIAKRDEDLVRHQLCLLLSCSAATMLPTIRSCYTWLPQPPTPVP